MAGGVGAAEREVERAGGLGLLLLALLVLMGQAGCPPEQPKQTPAPVQAPLVKQPYQRFIRMVTGGPVVSVLVLSFHGSLEC
jgi:hypothetical protein